MTHQVPDSVSMETLAALINAARTAKGDPPIGDVLPRLPLMASEAGLLDLTIAIEQLILRSGGVNFIQLLHAAAYLIDACKDGIDGELTNLSHRAAAAETPRECEVLNRVQSRLLTDMAALEHCLVVLGRILEPLTVQTIEVRASQQRTAKPAGVFPERRFLVSDDLLTVLGVSPHDFDTYFRARLEDDDFSS